MNNESQQQPVPEIKDSINHRPLKIAMYVIISIYNGCQLITFIIFSIITSGVAQGHGEFGGFVVIDVLIFIVIPFSIVGYCAFYGMKSMCLLILYGVLDVIMLLYTLVFGLVITSALRITEYYEDVENIEVSDKVQGMFQTYMAFAFLSTACQLATSICSCVACCRISPSGVRRIEIVHVIQMGNGNQNRNVNDNYQHIKQDGNMNMNYDNNMQQNSNLPDDGFGASQMKFPGESHSIPPSAENELKLMNQKI